MDILVCIQATLFLEVGPGHTSIESYRALPIDNKTLQQVNNIMFVSHALENSDEFKISCLRCPPHHFLLTGCQQDY